MTPSQLNWQKFLGFALPILLWWFTLAWLIGLTEWVSDFNSHGKYDFINLPLIAVWIVSPFVVSYAMGILSAYCWQHQSWGPFVRRSMVDNFSVYLWLVSFPLTILLFCSVLGLIVFPIQLTCYENGVKLGEEWVENRALNKFLGKENDWEREESSQ